MRCLRDASFFDPLDSSLHNDTATQLGGTGKTLVEGTTNEAATVKVNGQPAQVTKLGLSGPWRFQKEMDFPSGTTSITVEAKDGANNVRTNTYNVNVAASGAQTLEYDTNGNLLAVKDAGNVVLRSYEWDASNRLLAIQIPSAVTAGTKRTEFVYDGAGRRVRQIDKEHNGSAWTTLSNWYYLWNGLELAQKRDAATGMVLVNYFANGEQQGGNSLVYLSDHLGSPRSWYRVSDGAVGSADYSTYGVRIVTATGPGVPERGYTGHLHHPASGLALAPYRAYDPSLGRWISEDPIEERGGVNLYGYVGESPIRDTDSLGLFVNVENPMVNPHGPYAADFGTCRARGHISPGEIALPFAVYGVAAGGVFAITSEAATAAWTAAVPALKAGFKNIKIDGPQRGGRILPIEIREIPINSVGIWEMDDSEGSKDRLHLNIGPGKNNWHVPLDPRTWFD